MNVRPIIEQVMEGADPRKLLEAPIYAGKDGVVTDGTKKIAKKTGKFKGLIDKISTAHRFTTKGGLLQKGSEDYKKKVGDVVEAMQILINAMGDALVTSNWVKGWDPEIAMFSGQVGNTMVVDLMHKNQDFVEDTKWVNRLLVDLRKFGGEANKFIKKGEIERFYFWMWRMAGSFKDFFTIYAPQARKQLDPFLPKIYKMSEKVVNYGAY